MLTLAILRKRAIDLLVDQRAFLLNFLIMNVGSMVVMLLNFSVLTYLGRTLGLSTFGSYSLGLAVATTLMPAIDLGLPTFGTRELARDQSDAGTLLISITILRVALSGIVFLAILFVTPLILVSPQKEIVVISCFWLISYGFNADWFFQGLTRFRTSVAFKILYQIICCIAIFFLVHSESQVLIAVKTAPLVQLIVSLGITVFAVHTLKGMEIKYSVNGMMSYFRSAIPIGVAAIFAQSYSQRLDHVIIAMWRSMEDLALYSGAYTIHSAAVGVIQVVITLSFPLISKSYSRSRREFLEIIRLSIFRMVVVSFPLTMILMVFSKQILVLIFGSNYEPATWSLMILSLDPIIIGVSGIFAYSLIARGAGAPVILLYAIGLLVNIILDIILVPFIGINGAAIGTVAAEISVLMIGLYYFREYLRDGIQ